MFMSLTLFISINWKDTTADIWIMLSRKYTFTLFINNVTTKLK